MSTQPPVRTVLVSADRHVCDLRNAYEKRRRRFSGLSPPPPLSCACKGANVQGRGGVVGRAVVALGRPPSAWGRVVSLLSPGRAPRCGPRWPCRCTRTPCRRRTRTRASVRRPASRSRPARCRAAPARSSRAAAWPGRSRTSVAGSAATGAVGTRRRACNACWACLRVSVRVPAPSQAPADCDRGRRNDRGDNVPRRRTRPYDQTPRRLRRCSSAPAERLTRLCVRACAPVVGGSGCARGRDAKLPSVRRHCARRVFGRNARLPVAHGRVGGGGEDVGARNGCRGLGEQFSISR